MNLYSLFKKYEPFLGIVQAVTEPLQTKDGKNFYCRVTVDERKFFTNDTYIKVGERVRVIPQKVGGGRGWWWAELEQEVKHVL